MDRKHWTPRIATAVITLGILLHTAACAVNGNTGKTADLAQAQAAHRIIRTGFYVDSILVRYANGQEEKIPAPNLNGGGHNGADMVTLRKFFDYVDADIPEASEPERILSSVMIPMAAMSNQLVRTGEWYRSIIKSGK